MGNRITTPKNWANHKYIDKYKSAKTGKWVYIYKDESRRRRIRTPDGELHVDDPVVFSNSRDGMTKRQRERDDRKHRAYNKKRMVVNANRTLSNLGRAAKAAASGKDATRYLARSRKSAFKTARNITNLVTSYAGHTGEQTKVKSWLEKQIYKNGRPKRNWNPKGGLR